MGTSESAPTPQACFASARAASDSGSDVGSCESGSEPMSDSSEPTPQACSAPQLAQRANVRQQLQQQAPRSHQLQTRQQVPLQSLQHRGPSLRPSLASATQNFSTFNDDDELAAPTVVKEPAVVQPVPEVSADGPLSVATRIEYAAIPSGRSQDVFGIVTVQAAEVARAKDAVEDRQPLDIICVLDVSGSMTGEKIQLVQEAVRFVIKESDPKDRLSIVAFNHSAARVLRLARMHTEGKQEANRVTEQLSADGGTNITSGLVAALEIAERRRQRNPVSAILLLTDGQDGSRGEAYAPLLARAQRAGCSVYAFGFGADHDARLLAQIAEQAQTPFTFVEDVNSIGAAFAGAMGGLASTVAQRVELTLDCHAALKAVHTPFPSAQEGGRTVIQIPDMLAGERRDVLVEVSVPGQAESSDMLLLTAAARYQDLIASATGQTQSAEMRLRRTPSDEPQPEVEPDEEVCRQRDRVEVAQTLQTAAVHGDAGEFQQAQVLLSAHEARLRKSGHKSAVSEALALELQDAHARMQSRSSWEDGGMAELKDACQMHRMQRTTNMTVSSKSAQKMSKGMYATSVQQSWMSKSA